MSTETKTYPMLTLEKLSLIRRRVRNYNITREDLDWIEHYATSCGSSGQIKEICLDLGILSIEEALEVIQYRNNDFKEGYAAAGFIGSLTGMIDAMTRWVSNGEEIY